MRNVPVGKHWFQVNGIGVEFNEIVIKVDHIEPYRIPDRSFNINDVDFPSFNPKEVMKQIHFFFLNDIKKKKNKLLINLFYFKYIFRSLLIKTQLKL